MRFAFYSPTKLIRATSAHRSGTKFAIGRLTPFTPDADFSFGRAGIALPFEQCF
jgi:hypothetical protein